MSVVHVQAQELLRKWREAAGDKARFAGVVEQADRRLKVRLTWFQSGRLMAVDAFDHTDPLTAVRAAMAQSPWPDVGESDGAGSIEDAIEELLEIFDEIPQCDSFTLQPLNAAVEKERSRHAAQLAERDTRIAELEEALSKIREVRSEGESEDLVELRDLARMSGYLTDFGAQEKLRLLVRLAPYLLEASAERDAALTRFRGLREVVVAHQLRPGEHDEQLLGILDRFREEDEG